MSTDSTLLATASVTFRVAAPEGGQPAEGPTLALSRSDIREAASTDTITVAANGYDADTRAAINFTVLRDGQQLSNLNNVATLSLETYYGNMGYLGKFISLSSGSIPYNSFRPASSFSYNYFYLDFLESTHSRVNISWLRTGDYQIVFDLVEMAGGTDLALTWQGGRKLGGKNAAETGVVFDSKTVSYHVTEAATAAPDAETGIGDLTDGDGMEIWLNPARSAVTCTVPDANGDITVTDANGKVVFRTTAAERQTLINVSDWAAGIYFVTFRNENGTVTKKLAVTK